MPSHYSPADNQPLRAHLEAQLNFMTEFSNHLIDAGRRIAGVNVQFSRTLFEQFGVNCRNYMAAKDPGDFVLRMVNEVQPGMQRWRQYQQQVLDILNGAQSDLSKVTESHSEEVGRTAIAAVEDGARQISDKLQHGAEQVQRNAEQFQRDSERGADQARHMAEHTGEHQRDQARQAEQARAGIERETTPTRPDGTREAPKHFQPTHH